VHESCDIETLKVPAGKMGATAVKNNGTPVATDSEDALRSLLGSMQTSQLLAIAGIAVATKNAAASPQLDSFFIAMLSLTSKITVNKQRRPMQIVVSWNALSQSEMGHHALGRAPAN
jgi:ABC-type siderophore export system fused ATPase/permease subunit